jgi:hypothetical protein
MLRQTNPYFRHPRAGGDPTSNTSHSPKLVSRLRGNDDLIVGER